MEVCLEGGIGVETIHGPENPKVTLATNAKCLWWRSACGKDHSVDEQKLFFFDLGRTHFLEKEHSEHHEASGQSAFH